METKIQQSLAQIYERAENIEEERCYLDEYDNNPDERIQELKAELSEMADECDELIEYLNAIDDANIVIEDDKFVKKLYGTKDYLATIANELDAGLEYWKEEQEEIENEKFQKEEEERERKEAIKNQIEYDQQFREDLYRLMKDFGHYD